MFPTITEEALGALRARLGQPVRRPEPYIEVATRDAIRHWAHGIGDRNPYWATARGGPPTYPVTTRSMAKRIVGGATRAVARSEEHTSELQSRGHLVCRLLLEKNNKYLHSRIDII